jgi:hypothetical protein
MPSNVQPSWRTLTAVERCHSWVHAQIVNDQVATELQRIEGTEAAVIMGCRD